MAFGTVNCRCRQITVLAILQTCCGAVIVAFTALVLSADYAIGIAYPAGVICILAGGLGIGAVKQQTKCLYKGCQWVSALAAGVVPLLFIVSAVDLSSNVKGSCVRKYTSNRSDWVLVCVADSKSVAMDASLLVMSIVMTAVSIWQFVLCWHVRRELRQISWQSRLHSVRTGPYIVSANMQTAGQLQFPQTSPSGQLQVMSPSGYSSGTPHAGQGTYPPSRDRLAGQGFYYPSQDRPGAQGTYPLTLNRPAGQGTYLPSRDQLAGPGTYLPTSQGTGLHSPADQPPSYDEVTSVPPAYADVISRQGHACITLTLT